MLKVAKTCKNLQKDSKRCKIFQKTVAVIIRLKIQKYKTVSKHA